MLTKLLQYKTKYDQSNQETGVHNHKPNTGNYSNNTLESKSSGAHIKRNSTVSTHQKRCKMPVPRVLLANTSWHHHERYQQVGRQSLTVKGRPDQFGADIRKHASQEE